MNLLVLLSEGATNVLEICVGLAAIAATFISLSAYRHTRNSENAKQADVIELKKNVGEKADKSYVDQQDRSLHHRIDEVKSDHGKLLEEIRGDIKQLLARK